MYYCGAHSGLAPIWRDGGISACFLDTLCSAMAVTCVLLASLRVFAGKKAPETHNVIGNKVCMRATLVMILPAIRIPWLRTAEAESLEISSLKVM